MSPAEKQAFDQMREALERIYNWSNSVYYGTDTTRELREAKTQASEALTAANAVSEQHARDAVTWTPETGYVFAEQPQAQGEAT